MSTDCTQAIILAHGRGDHCFPFGGEKAIRPKYVMEVCDVPLVVRGIQALREAGIERITVAAGFRAEMIEAAIDNSVFADVGVIRVPVWDRGDALPLAHVISDRSLEGPLVVMNGDLLVDTADVRALLGTFADSGADAAIMVDLLDEGEDRESWIGVHLEGDRIGAFRGHVGSVNRLTGLAVVSNEHADLLRDGDPGSQDRRYLDSQWKRLLDSGATIAAVRPSHPVVHVDRCFDYFEVNNVMRDRMLANIATAEGAYVHIAGEGDPDPRYIFPGTVITPGKRLVFEEGSFIGPYETHEGHMETLSRGVNPGMIDIRVRGSLHLGRDFRIGLNSLIEGDVVTGEGGFIEDGFVGSNIVLGDDVRIRHGAFLRGGSVCGSGSWFECGADFSGVAGPGTHWVHPGQCWVVTGRKVDFGAGCWCGTWRFDSGSARFMIGGRLVTPKDAGLANATFIGDEVRTAIFSSFAPGTRVGTDTLIGQGVSASRDCEAGKYYELNQDITVHDVSRVREPRHL